MLNGNVRPSAPLVSIVMPAYCAEKYIEAAIQSVVDQTYTNWELLVLDDGSQDNTIQIVQALAKQDSRIRLYQNERNMGPAKTRNRGLDLSQGDYTAFLDSDDIWHADKLEKQVALAEREHADIAYCSYAIIDGNNSKRCNDFLVPSRTDLKGLLKKNVIGCSTVLLSRATVGDFRFSTDYYHEDYVLWLSMLQTGKKAVGLEEVLVDYRFHASGRAANKASSAKHRWHIYRSFLGLSVVQSLYYLSHYALNGIVKYRPK